MEEIWKRIEQFEEYEISNYGRFKSYNKNKKGKILKYRKDSDGYYCVTLYNNKNILQISVHRLVAINFIPNLLNKKEVNHIDENKNNNKSNNLEWVTHKENMNHGTINIRKSEKMKSHKINVKKFEYYETNPIKRNHFKTKCKKENINFYDFLEVFSGEKNLTNKKFFYFLKDDM